MQRGEDRGRGTRGALLAGRGTGAACEARPGEGRRVLLPTGSAPPARPPALWKPRHVDSGPRLRRGHVHTRTRGGPSIPRLAVPPARPPARPPALGAQRQLYRVAVTNAAMLQCQCSTAPQRAVSAVSWPLGIAVLCCTAPCRAGAPARACVTPRGSQLPASGKCSSHVCCAVLCTRVQRGVLYCTNGALRRDQRRGRYCAYRAVPLALYQWRPSGGAP